MPLINSFLNTRENAFQMRVMSKAYSAFIPRCEEPETQWRWILNSILQVTKYFINHRGKWDQLALPHKKETYLYNATIPWTTHMRAYMGVCGRKLSCVYIFYHYSMRTLSITGRARVRNLYTLILTWCLQAFVLTQQPENRIKQNNPSFSGPF